MQGRIWVDTEVVDGNTPNTYVASIITVCVELGD